MKKRNVKEINIRVEMTGIRGLVTNQLFSGILKNGYEERAGPK